MTKSNFQNVKQEIVKTATKARALINDIIDSGTFVEIGAFFSYSSCDIVDGLTNEGVVTGFGLVKGIPCYLFAQNQENMSGGFSETHAKKIANLYNLACATKTPVICILDSFGARINEGVGCLEGYANLLATASEFSGTAPQISVVAGKAYGIISALPEICDFSIMLEGAEKGATSSSVLSAKESITAKDVLSAKGNHNKGNCDIICSSKDLKETIAEFLDLTLYQTKGELQDFDGNENLKENITKEELIKEIADDGKYLELKSGYGKNAMTALARLSGVSAAIIAVDGKLNVDSCEKISRFINLANDFALPIVTFVNCDGQEVSIKEEEKGLSRAIAKVISSSTYCQTAMISVVYGKATGAAYTALVSKKIGVNVTLSWDSAVISPLSTDTAIEIYYQDILKDAKNKDELRKQLEERFVEEYGSAIKSASKGYIDNVFEPKFTKNYLVSALQMLESKFSFDNSKKPL